MKHILNILLILSFICSNINAQVDDDWNFITGMAVEKMPTFIGGDEALMRYLNTSAIYPESILEQCINGRVYIDFEVDKLGKVNDLKILKGLHPELDSIALRIIRNMPDWIPAEQRGKSVVARYVLPITFGANFENNPPIPTRYWRKKGLKQFEKVCKKEYNLSKDDINCWYDFIVWNHNNHKLKDIDLELMFKRQKCK